MFLRIMSASLTLASTLAVADPLPIRTSTDCFAYAQSGTDTWKYGIGLPHIAVAGTWDMTVEEPQILYVDVSRNGEWIARPTANPVGGRGNIYRGELDFDSMGATIERLFIRFHVVNQELYSVQVWHGDRYGEGRCRRVS